MSAVICPQDMAEMPGKLNAQLEHGNTIQNENRLICKDGTVKWVSIKAQLFTEKGKEQYFYCVFVDITDEKQLQEREKDLYETGTGLFRGTGTDRRDHTGTYQCNAKQDGKLCEYV